MNTMTPSRPKDTVVRLTEPEFTGEMHTVCTLDETPSTLTLRMLIAGDQLAVSPSGSQIAMVRNENLNHEAVTHSGFEGRFKFDRPASSSQVGTRIISVAERALCVWGRAQGRPPGVWLLTPGSREYLYPLETLCGFYGAQERVPVGQSSEYPGDNVLVMPWGLWPVRSGSKIEVVGHRLYVLEPMDGSVYAYCVDSEGVERFTQVWLPDALRVIPFGHSSVAVGCFHGRSLVREIGVAASGSPFTMSLEGRVIQAWGSPCTDPNTLALLVRHREVDGDVLGLYLNRQLVFEGDFIIGHQDLTWSPTGRSFAARIKTDGREMVVTPAEERILGEGKNLREVLVDDNGRIVAMIVGDGGWDRIVLSGGRSGTAVPMAWNLHEDPDAAIVWNTVHDDQILRWVDRTHLHDEHLVETTAR